MTTDIRETLHDVGASVAPPAIDQSAFDGHVRRARRRRRAGQLAVAAASAVAVGVTAWLVALDGGGGDGDMVADLPSTGVSPTSQHVLAFEEQGRLFVSTPQDPSIDVDTGIRLEEVVAVIHDRVVYIDPESHLMQVAVRDDGTVGEPRTIWTTEPVQWAGVDSHDSMVWWVTLDDQIGRVDPDEAFDEVVVYNELTPDTTVLAVGVARSGAGRSVTSVGGGSVQLHSDGRSYDIPSDAMSAELADDTLAVMTTAGTEIWSALDGTRLFGARGYGTAALSTDGRWVASGADDLDLDSGAEHGVRLVDTETGEVHEVPFADDTGPIVDIWWEDHLRYFVVVETNADGQPLHTLYECVVGGACQYRIEDETGTLWLPRD